MKSPHHPGLSFLSRKPRWLDGLISKFPAMPLLWLYAGTIPDPSSAVRAKYWTPQEIRLKQTWKMASNPRRSCNSENSEPTGPRNSKSWARLVLWGLILSQSPSQQWVSVTAPQRMSAYHAAGPGCRVLWEHKVRGSSCEAVLFCEMPPTRAQAHALPRAHLNSHVVSNIFLPSELGVLTASIQGMSL